MEWFNDIQDLEIQKSVVSVGTFDGLHQGHRIIIDKTVQKAREQDAYSVIFTFWPHPQEIILPEKKIYYLNTFQEKIDQFSKTGIDYLILFPFNHRFSQLPYQQFIKDYLVDQLKMKYFLVGYDHHFGKNREGYFDNLTKIAKQNNFEIEKVKRQTVQGSTASSTAIRNLLKEGDVQKANDLLTYAYYLSGKIKKGKGIGKTIHFPTANIEYSHNKLIPKNGVYIGTATYKDTDYKAICNIGFNPTINQDKELSVEVHILDFNQNIYNQDVTFTFLKRLRDEQKFDSIEILRQQIEKDKASCLSYFNNKK